MQQIADAFVNGDNEAFRMVYEKTKDFVANVIYKMIRNKEETEDLMHDIYLKLFEKRGSYNEHKATLKTWIYQIAVNHTLNHLKRRKWLNNNLFKLVKNDEEAGHLENIERQEAARTAEMALGRVNPKFRVCIIMKDLEDKSYAEIAAILGINIGTVRSRINRGRKQLLKFMKRGDGYE